MPEEQQEKPVTQTNKPAFTKPQPVLWSIFGTANPDDNPYGIKNIHGIVEDRIYPEEGGMLTKLVGCSYLFKGYPDGRIMKQLEVSKNALWIIVDIFSSIKILMIPAAIVFFFLRRLAKRYFIRLCHDYFKTGYKPLVAKKFILEEKNYCTSVKELYKASKIILADIKNDKLKEVFSKFRDIVLMIIEFDTVYRFQTQDVLPEFNIENLKKKPVKEIQRVFKILQQREHSKSQRNKYIKIGKKMIFILRISKKLRKRVVEFLSNIDYEKIKLDEADWYYCLQRHLYDYRGVSIEERIAEKERIDKEKGHRFPIFQFVQSGEKPSSQLKILKPQ